MCNSSTPILLMRTNPYPIPRWEHWSVYCLRDTRHNIWKPVIPQTEDTREMCYTLIGLCHISALTAPPTIDGSISRSSILANGALRGLIVRCVTGRVDSYSLIADCTTCGTADHCCCCPNNNWLLLLLNFFCHRCCCCYKCTGSGWLQLRDPIFFCPRRAAMNHMDKH